MGDFSIKAKVEGKARTWKADVVCLTDENRHAPVPVRRRNRAEKVLPL